MNKLVAIIGMSGSGKSIATDYLESQGVDLRDKDFENIKIDLPFENTNKVVNTPKPNGQSNNFQTNTNNPVTVNQPVQSNNLANNQMINDIEEFL